jgi:hypothetical protein
MNSYRYLFVSILALSSVVAVCQTNSAPNDGTGCKELGATVEPPSNPMEGVTQLPIPGQPPKTPISCAPPKTPIYSLSATVLAPSVSKPPQPEMKQTLPQAPTVTQVTNTSSSTRR